ncbi:hypothetical protein CA54_16580 [Symmachiella macrocystis]|uniref:Nicotinamide mononucleotide transporter n=1 Tax=Symmachiella macrocystis TaxID=2527985 RepID=A0A5C6BM31_9PLAN|nr:hypothetical protein [Symmachiella macrocystis]TWU12832.1 hypothetical protein CA54_16580 [Symmachiella macrocystis]
MDWIAGFLTLISMEMIARHKWQGWAVGLVNQVTWLVLIFNRELWGLLPLNVVLTWRFSVALMKWREAAKEG